MHQIKSSHIKNYLAALIMIFVFVLALTNISFFQTINKISIESNLYQTIKESQELKADILPPKLYIVESYLIVQRMTTETDAGKMKTMLKEMEITRNEYINYYEAWKSKIQNEDVISLLTVSNAYVTAFYQIYDTEFVAAEQKSDYLAMRAIANDQMNPLFEDHRDIINQMSDLLEASNEKIEAGAKTVVDRSQMILLSISLVSLLLVLIISVVIFKKVLRIEEKIVDSQHETEMANERLEIMVNGLKQYKHSYENTIASINGYALQGDYTGLKKYLNEIIAQKSRSEAANYFKLDFIKNPALLGLLISKIMYAEEQGVKPVLKVRGDAAAVDIQTCHLCEILGILLDNAIEAARESKDKMVSFKIEESEEACVFEIKNSIDRMPDRVKMFEKNWSTKGENRGFGLWNAGNIIKRYENVILNTTVDQNFVEQDLIVLKKEKENPPTYFTDVL